MKTVQAQAIRPELRQSELRSVENVCRKVFSFSETGVQDLVSSVLAALETDDVTCVRNFPCESTVFVQFLAQFGDVLPNYGQGNQDELHSVHPAINRVKVATGDKRNYIHGRGGGLTLHSARSWRHPRPRFFSMLMVDPGWIDNAVGENGESLCVRWAEVLAFQQLTQEATFKRDLEVLTSTSITFPANNVVEVNTNLPLLYRLREQRHELDFGARVKSDILEKMKGWRSQVDDFDCYYSAALRFLDASNDLNVVHRYQMHRGDLIFMDNNRVGHGRSGLVARRLVDGKEELNPRELWSACVE